MRRITITAGLVLLGVQGMLGQGPPPGATQPEFDVASVKPNKPTGDGFFMTQITPDPGMDRMTNVTLRDYLRAAYDVKDFQISGPDWLNTDRFDIMAKMPPDTPKDQVRLMRQKLLEERFKLAVHREKRVMPVYALVPGKGGVKIQPSAEEADGSTKRGGMMRMSPGHLDAEKLSFSTLADMLSRLLDRPVIDMTGNKGLFDFKLDFNPEGTQMIAMKMAGRGMPMPEGGMQAKKGEAASDAPSIFAAVQDTLGLKLEGRKEPTDILVIDHAERVPVEN